MKVLIYIYLTYFNILTECGRLILVIFVDLVISFSLLYLVFWLFAVHNKLSSLNFHNHSQVMNLLTLFYILKLDIVRDCDIYVIFIINKQLIQFQLTKNFKATLWTLSIWFSFSSQTASISLEIKFKDNHLWILNFLTKSAPSFYGFDLKVNKSTIYCLTCNLYLHPSLTFNKTVQTQNPSFNFN